MGGTEVWLWRWRWLLLLPPLPFHWRPALCPLIVFPDSRQEDDGEDEVLVERVNDIPGLIASLELVVTDGGNWGSAGARWENDNHGLHPSHFLSQRECSLINVLLIHFSASGCFCLRRVRRRIGLIQLAEVWLISQSAVRDRCWWSGDIHDSQAPDQEQVVDSSSQF